MTTVAEKVAEKFNKPEGMSTKAFFESNPVAARVLSNVMSKAEVAKNKTMMMAAKGGYVGYANGGDTETTATTTPVEPDDVPTKTPEELAAETNALVGQRSITAATDPTSLATKTEVAKIDTTDTGQKVDPSTGQLTGLDPTVIATKGVATTADTPTTDLTPNLATTTSAEDATEQALKSVSAKTGTVSSDAKVTAATGTVSKTGTGDIEQITDISQVETPTKRVIEDDEKISGSAVDLAAVDKHLEITAATANPSKKATVKGQLDDLMDDFDGGATPAWAAGAMRAATAAMAARGLGASSMAGQAIIQATMESALPIAQQDASTAASFEVQNLSNKQQVVMFAAEQRAKFMEIDFNQEFQTRVANAAKVSDIANMNFTSEQQIALENARLTQTTNLANMSAINAKVMADAAALSNMDLANLSNEQQAVVQNAKSFLQVDMTNLANNQQTEMFKAQAVQQSILSDTAASNATSQFNASSKNQVDQFMATMKTQVDQFNATQQNAMAEFNAGEENAVNKFNSELTNQRDQFNASNALVIAQANAVWRQNLATLDTAAQNDANKLDAASMNNLTEKSIDDIWQRERDAMAWAVATSESASERHLQILLADKDVSTAREKIASDEATSKSAFYSTLIFGDRGLDLGNKALKIAGL